MSELALLKRIARQIRYQTLERVIGQQIAAADLEALKQKLLDVVAAELETPAEWAFQAIPMGALYKYGLLDLTLVSDADVFGPQAESGIRLLDRMGWIDREQSFVKDETESILMDLWEDIGQRKTFLKAHLVSDRSAASQQGFAFRVQDAFLTNAPAIGLWKNFYL